MYICSIDGFTSYKPPFHWDWFVPVFSHVFLKIVLFKAPQLDWSPSLIFVQVFSDVFPIQSPILSGFADMFLYVSHIFMRISHGFPMDFATFLQHFPAIPFLWRASGCCTAKSMAMPPPSEAPPRTMGRFCKCCDQKARRCSPQFNAG